jgi:hypothetical protein
MNFVWILVGGTYGDHSGEHQRYSLIEYNSDVHLNDNNKLRVSEFDNICNFWTDINDFNSHQNQIIQKMLRDGKKFLCRDFFGYFGYRDMERFQYFNSEENEVVHNELTRLIFNKCLK